MKSWSDLTKEEKEEIKTKMSCEVKVKFLSGLIIGFNPFRVCASFPAKYLIKNYSNGGTMEYKYEHELKLNIMKDGIESNNVKYLEEAQMIVDNIKLNLEL